MAKKKSNKIPMRDFIYSQMGKYEGQQYKGGRGKNHKNLTYLPDGGIVNKNGVFFTPEEKKKLEQMVNTANRKRTKMLKEWENLPRKNAGEDTGETNAALKTMGKESDFIIARRSKSLQRFSSREQFDRYIDSLAKVNNRDYIDDRTRMYKRNYMKALEDVFGDDAKDVKMKIRMTKPDEYRKMVMSDEVLEISFIYDPQDKAKKLNEIRKALGMKTK